MQSKQGGIHDRQFKHHVKLQQSVLGNDILNDDTIGYMATGITLYHTDESDVVLARVIKLFSFVNQQPQASQILMCRSNTNFEEINCFLHRCSHHNNQERLLYCLVQPEYLKETVTDEILQILFKTLRNTRAFFTVITADKKSKWYSYLQIYNEVLEPLTDTQRETFYKKYICTDLDTFIHSLKNFNRFSLRGDNQNVQQNPLCMVFLSEEECVGKTHEIKRLCKDPAAWLQTKDRPKDRNLKFHLVHIPFNSPKVDKDFVVCCI